MKTSAIIVSIFFSRREASPLRGVRKVVQPVVQPDHPHAQAQWLQTVCVRALPKALSKEGGPQETQGLTAHRGKKSLMNYSS